MAEYLGVLEMGFEQSSARFSYDTYNFRHFFLLNRTVFYFLQLYHLDRRSLI